MPAVSLTLGEVGLGRKRKRVPQAPEEVREHLADQLRFLEKSAADYDAGDRAEAKRMALHLRVVLHDSKTSRSLLRQLDLADTLFYDTCEEYDPRAIGSFDGSLVMRVSTEGSHYLAPLDDVPFRTVKPFHRWWTKTYFVDNESTRFSRSDLVLAVANQDGGGHVDPAVERAYWKLSRDNSMGWVRRGGDVDIPMESPVPPALRQITHEVLATLLDRIPPRTPKGEAHLPGPPGFGFTTPPVRAEEEPGRNDPCHCGSGLKYKKCHGRATNASG